jgi:hypothetical protein
MGSSSHCESMVTWGTSMSMSNKGHFSHLWGVAGGGGVDKGGGGWLHTFQFGSTLVLPFPDRRLTSFACEVHICDKWRP